LIEVHSAHDPDSLRGPTFDFIWYDEVAKGSKLSFDILLPTLLASEGQFLGSTTPRGRQNWIYETLYLKAVPPGEPDHDPDKYNPAYGVVTGRTRENVDNLSDEAVSVLEDQYGAGSLFYNQELEGEFVTFHGLVYGWDELKNYVPHDKLPPIEECSLVIGGLDFGWHPDPTAAVVLGYKDGRWNVYDCLYENKLLTNDLAMELALLTKKYQVGTWYADSARPDEIADLQQRGLPVRAVSKPRIVVRVREMAMFTDSNRFKVSHRAPDVRNELTMYQWPPSEKLNRVADPNPVDKFNHAMDAIGYALWSVRYLWRNDPGVEIQKRGLDNPLDDPDVEPLLEEMLRDSKRRKQKQSGSAPAGLYSS
jgi:phage terminase large subunit